MQCLNVFLYWLQDRENLLLFLQNILILSRGIKILFARYFNTSLPYKKHLATWNDEGADVSAIRIAHSILIQKKEIRKNAKKRQVVDGSYLSHEYLS